MKKFTRQELNRIPELKHLEVIPGPLGGYRGTMFEYRRKIVLGETTIAGLTQDESIAAVDQATDMQIADLEAFLVEAGRERNRHVWKVLGTTIMTVIAMTMLVFLILTITSGSGVDSSPALSWITSRGSYLIALMIPMVMIAGAVYALRPQQ